MARWIVASTFKSHYAVMCDFKIVDYYADREIAQAYVDYMNRQATI